jgi:hypothetical protein
METWLEEKMGGPSTLQDVVEMTQTLQTESAAAADQPRYRVVLVPVATPKGRVK